MSSFAEDELKIALGSVYDPPDEPYRRLLIMRRWPRGVTKDAVDDWERNLGPSNELLDAYNSDEIEWDAFARRYREEMAARPEMLDWVAGQARRAGVTLLCGSHPEDQCHRSLLASLIRERAGEG